MSRYDCKDLDRIQLNPELSVTGLSGSVGLIAVDSHVPPPGGNGTVLKGKALTSPVSMCWGQFLEVPASVFIVFLLSLPRVTERSEMKYLDGMRTCSSYS